MKITAPLVVDISDAAAKEIVVKVLNDQIIQGRWIEDGKVMEEHYTSHRFDAAIGRANDPQFALLKAALLVRDSLLDRRK